jgi:hypothetical protein
MTRPSKERPERIYRFETIVLDNDLKLSATAPKELRYALKKNPDLEKEIVGSLNNGKLLALRTIAVTPDRVLSAINAVAIYSQHRIIVTWLGPLLRHQIRPLFLASDLDFGTKDHINLDDEVNIILAHRLEFKKFVLIDQSSSEVPEKERLLLKRLNDTIDPIIIDHVVRRMTFDNADTRTSVAQAIIKALLFIGPVTQVLEMYTKGFGKIFAASTDDVLSETAELFALRGSGFRWPQLLKRSRILIPVFIVASISAYQVDTLIELGLFPLAGALFGAAAVALSLTTALQSIRMYKQCVDDLVADKKLPDLTRWEKWRLAIQQDFTNPARLGLFLGAGISPLLAMTVFILFPQLVHNGWVLALLGTAETLTAGFVVLFARQLNYWRFRMFLNKLLKAKPSYR